MTTRPALKKMLIGSLADGSKRTIDRDLRSYVEMKISVKVNIWVITKADNVIMISNAHFCFLQI